MPTPATMNTSPHFILYVRDQERARAFYEAALGVAPRLHAPGMTEFALPGGAVLGLMPEAGIRRLLPDLPDPALARGAPRAETYLIVAEPRASLARAVAAGATELSPVLPRDWGDDAGYCLDPDGHVLAFAAPTPPTAEGPAVELRAFDAERDLARVAAWLEEPDARRWWGDPIVALTDLVEREPGTAAVVAWDGRPVGVLCWQVPTREELEDAGLADLPRDLVDVDVLIGETDARGHGVAPEALRQLCARLREQGVRLVGMGAAKANEPALVAYVRAGFEPYRDFEEDGEGYRYFTRELVEDA
jgi:RimJ/RimL family protein N-acetyltransferase/predicted enzyme related to lactoylglutathione lyase